MIGRRSIVLAAASLLALPAAAWAQLASGLPRIAIVDPGEPVESIAEGGNPNWSTFLAALRGLGHVEGTTIVIYRWSISDQSNDGFGRAAEAVIETGPDVIVARGTRLITTFQQATGSIPLVGIGGFPPGIDLARPGGNLTGFQSPPEITAKRFQLLHDVVPAATRVAWLGPPDNWDLPILVAMRDEAGQLGLELVPVFIDTPIEEAGIRRAFGAMAGQDLHALYLSGFPAMIPFHRVIAWLARAAGLPAIAGDRLYAEAGLLMSYGPDLGASYRGAAGYVDQILGGADPAEMAIEQSTEFEFVLNLRTAADLGLTVSPSVVLFATELIE